MMGWILFVAMATTGFQQTASSLDHCRSQFYIWYANQAPLPEIESAYCVNMAGDKVWLKEPR